ncbi:N-acetylmuramoyl-L-alanine amidase [Hathewaya proteolytica DSM 3090]|uniref:N-acetylmuramoyl-L-alanine amidase n=1 Tax=Hathewaya proteolytica DSM 3090 TaxID=1121331 RepID=A0A1M6Q869_9CLOT|nr:N-acetylmuramoyl-L-alanine amidase [Hathewaya proteolytica]SHK16348.1 N-acetylmuramoyl-L-alanine amidase [Hathewaya proteolytica DSM 3090]
MKTNNTNTNKSKGIFNVALMIILVITLFLSVKKLNDNHKIELEYKKQVAAETAAKASSKTQKNIALPAEKINKAYAGKVVVLDPGHGGFDEGASTQDGSLVEKDITLKICKKIKQYLNKEGIEVVLTRDSDKPMENATNEKEDLRTRSKLINSYENAVLMLSVHNNSNEDDDCFGIFNYISSSPNIDTSKSMDLSSSILKSIATSSNWKTNSTLEQDIYILNKATMPSILVECGFLSNKTDISNLKNPQQVDDLCKAMAKGIKDYMDKNR